MLQQHEQKKLDRKINAQERLKKVEVKETQKKRERRRK